MLWTGEIQGPPAIDFRKKSSHLLVIQEHKFSAPQATGHHWSTALRLLLRRCGLVNWANNMTF